MANSVYRCIDCGKTYPITPDRMLCSTCSVVRRSDEPLKGLLQVEMDAPLPENWTSADLLPVGKQHFPPVPVGNTPLWTPENLRRRTGISNLYLKDDGLNPTGSLKDRASYLVAAFARKHGIEDIIVASTGNAGSSMAGIGAAAGLNVRLYLPESAPEAKMAQALQYGAALIRVKGNYDLAYEESMNYVAKNGGLSRNTAYNPMTVEGKKTVSLEIYRQLGSKAPEFLFVSAGDGVILSGVYKGFEDLLAHSLIQRIPTIFAVQATGSAAISRAFRYGKFTTPVSALTVADSISVDVPRGGYFALQRLKKHGGEVVEVSDDEILGAQHELSASTGLFAEPAAAAAAAGFMKAKNRLPKDACCVVLLTGNGLKDVGSALTGVTSSGKL